MHCRGVTHIRLSTILESADYDFDICFLPRFSTTIGTALPPTVSSVYLPILTRIPRTRMMQGWADFLERTQRGGKVLPFRGSAA